MKFCKKIIFQKNQTKLIMLLIFTAEDEVKAVINDEIKILEKFR